MSAAAGAAVVRRLVEDAEEVQPAPIDLGEEGTGQRESLLLVADAAQVWRTPQGETCATVHIDEHVEHHAVRSAAFRDWLLGTLARTCVRNGRPASASDAAVREALSALEARAFNERQQYGAVLRVARTAGSIWIDRGTPDWSAIEVTAEGWWVRPTPPVPILRSRRTGPLPLPVRGDGFRRLRRILHRLSETDFILLVSWCLGSLWPEGPYPVLILSGEAGAGKSSLARLIQRLTDPVTGDLLQPPANDRDLIATARNGRILAFDNLSGLKAELADSLCRLATGSEIGGRALFTDHDMASFTASRPLVLNGIPDLAARGDLADRAVVIRLPPLATRTTEADLREEIAAAHPEILGALLDALSEAMKRVTEVATPPVRMADFARVLVAAEPRLPWPSGGFLNAYRLNRAGIVQSLVEGDLVARSVADLMERHGPAWSGLKSELYDQLSGALTPDAKRAGDWPGNPRWFADRLTRATPALRQTGIEVTERREGRGVRVDLNRTAAPATPDTSIDVGNAAGRQGDAAGAADAATETTSDPQVAGWSGSL